MKYFLIIFFLFTSIIVNAQLRAKTEDGRVVILNANGTWQFEDNTDMTDGIPTYIYNQIVNKIKREYPNEYTVQKTIIDMEIKNYKAVKNYSDSRVPNNILNQIKQKIINEYPNEYTTQKTLIDMEIKNYLEMNRR
jgi:hypothetical protein